MNDRLKFFRTFLIFKQEDKGYGSGKEPSGYIKIEVRGGKGKLIAAVQNLKEDKSRFSYKLYILKHTEEKVIPVKVGTIPLKNGKGEIKWEFDPTDVDRTGSSIDEFTAAAVLVEFSDRKNTVVICPLVAYKDKKVNWRRKLKAALFDEKEKEPEKRELEKKVPEEKESIKTQDAISKYTGGLESKYEPSEKKSEEDKTKENLEEARESFLEEGFKVEKQEYTQKDEKEDQDKKSKKEQEKQEESIETSEKSERLMEKTESVDEDKLHKLDEERDSEANRNSVAEKAEAGDEKKAEEKEETTQKEAEPEKDGKCMFKNNQYCGIDTSKAGFNPCENCYMINKSKEMPKTERVEGDIEKLKISLDKNFERYDPFRTRRRDYSWWKLNSPVQLNNVLYQCNIKTPLLFNPSVMMAHFKYRHLIVGIYTDRMRRREYIVCGIPGVYRVDERPFGDMCRWVQLEGSRPRYGAFGYWLVYIDPKSGKILALR